MKINIREGVKEDLPTILELIKELADFENARDQVTITLEDLEKDGFEGNPWYWFLVAEKDNKTPLQLAETPNLDALVQKGQCGSVQTIPDNLHPGNEVSGLGLFGYCPEKYKVGHAALDAVGLGIKPSEDEITLCCDLITLQATHDDMIMKDYTGGNLCSEDSELLINALNEQVMDSTVKFYHGKGYHNLAVIKNPKIQFIAHKKTTKWWFLWAQQGLNLRPLDYESSALTS